MAWMLKLAGACIGGKSIAVCASSPTVFCTRTKRQNSRALRRSRGRVGLSVALLYTGVTRGKRLVILLGQKKAVAIAVKNVSGRRRWSKLREWLNPVSLRMV